MVFSSLIFMFVFLPITLLVYYALPHRFRNLFLVMASLTFYAWGEPVYIVVMLFSIVMNYLFGLLLLVEDRKLRKMFFIGGVAANVGLLLFFKYSNFVIDNLNMVLPHWGYRTLSSLDLALPIGISFYTFQALSYLIDAYRGLIPVQRSLLLMALYKSLFPQLIAGPIVRYTDVVRDLADRIIAFDDFATGSRRFIVGFAKKMIIANPMGLISDKLFSMPPNELTFATAWLGVIAYALQIYFDFSGYSDMAIGIGRQLGFHFHENFNYPYIATSVQDFWRRWHISLSSWFRDYLYIPLGGNRHGRGRTCFNLLLVFFLCGLWHGASWTFVFWGLLHGFFLVVERAGLNELLQRLPRWVARIYTLSVVFIGWVFFRCDTGAHARHYIASLLNITSIFKGSQSLGMYVNPQLGLTIAIGILASTPLLKQWHARVYASNRFFVMGELAWMGGLLLISFAYLASGTYNPFIYYRF